MRLTPWTRQRYAPSVTGSRPPQSRRVARVVYAVYVLLVSAFVVSNIVQVARALFGSEGTTASVPAPVIKGDCANLLKAQTTEIDRARVLASEEQSGEAARATYAAARKKAREQAGDLDRACTSDPRGTDALAALARLDRAAESHAVRTAAELSPVRLAAQSFISGDRP